MVRVFIDAAVTKNEVRSGTIVVKQRFSNFAAGRLKSDANSRRSSPRLTYELDPGINDNFQRSATIRDSDAAIKLLRNVRI